MAELIALQLDVLLERDRDGRLLATRDAPPRPAPRLFLGRSPAANAWATRAGLDPATERALHRFCAAEPRPERLAVDHTPVCRERALALLAPVGIEHRGPAYVLPQDLPGDDRARLVSAEERADWSEAFPWLAEEFEAVSPVAIAFVDGRPAAVCHSPRGCTARAAEAGVETIERFRGRGLASAAVACWARAVQRSGRLALYSTSWENAASRAVASRLGARLYGEDWHVS